METLVATAGSSFRVSVARSFPRACLIAFPAVAILLAQAATVAVAIDVNLSTGNLSYNDGQGHAMPYRLYVPPGYNTAGAKFPLIMFLHGSGESGTDNNKPSTNGHIDNLYNAAHGNFGAQYDAFLLVPQTLSSVGWEDYGSQYPQYYGQVLAMDILNQVTSTYQVDTRRLYVTGLSMGGGGTFDIISHYPHEFAAASPLSGWGDTSMAPVLKDIPIWAYHGAADTTVSVSYTDEMVAAIQAAGGNMIEYTRPAGVGHSGWETFYNNTTYKNSKGQTFDQWMFAQSLPTPEPSTLVLLGAGAIIVAAYCRRRRRLGALPAAFVDKTKTRQRGHATFWKAGDSSGTPRNSGAAVPLVVPTQIAHRGNEIDGRGTGPFFGEKAYFRINRRPKTWTCPLPAAQIEFMGETTATRS